MINERQITQLATDCLKGTDRFVVFVKVGTGNQIQVVIDGDAGVTIDHCVELSRFIENSFDRDVEDFELKVSTAGIDYPYINLRQYKKNVGRAVEILLKGGGIKRGKLKSADEDSIEIEEELIRKNKKSKKMETGPSVRIPMDEINQTKGLVIF
ncbi:MAG: ribosome assembly cofactor RimP [Bacteroidales bacterium]|nr:ribosome assembly cofactor RimP [Bacteroidales bacterium]MCF6341881.1 ribosome assembly cofactor RimP [Bacteroidales bacterium]